MTIIQEEFHWRRSNSIERLDAFKKHLGWAPIEIPDTPLTVRRSPGVVQVSLNEILIFGGAAENELKAIYHWNVKDNTIRKSKSGSQFSINPGQTPAVLGVDDSVVTGEYGTLFVYVKERRGGFQRVKDLENDVDPEDMMAE